MRAADAHKHFGVAAKCVHKEIAHFNVSFIRHFGAVRADGDGEVLGKVGSYHKRTAAVVVIYRRADARGRRYALCFFLGVKANYIFLRRKGGKC